MEIHADERRGSHGGNCNSQSRLRPAVRLSSCRLRPHGRSGLGAATASAPCIGYQCEGVILLDSLLSPTHSPASDDGYRTTVAPLATAAIFGPPINLESTSRRPPNADTRPAPAVGQVRIDGSELAHWNRDQLGPYIGYLPQDIELFSGTLAGVFATNCKYPCRRGGPSRTSIGINPQSYR